MDSRPEKIPGEKGGNETRVGGDSTPVITMAVARATASTDDLIPPHRFKRAGEESAMRKARQDAKGCMLASNGAKRGIPVKREIPAGITAYAPSLYAALLKLETI
jgi:hypothetical protein